MLNGLKVLLRWVLALAILAGLGYGGWRLFGHLWASALLACHIGIGVLCLVISVWSWREAHRMPEQASYMAVLDAHTQQRWPAGLGMLPLIVGWVQFSLGGWLFFPLVMLTVSNLDEERPGTYRRIAMDLESSGIQFLLVPWMLALVLVAYAVEWHWPGQETPIRIFLGMCLANVALRHVLYSIGEVSFIDLLKRPSRNAYVLFLLIGAADFTTLLLCANGLFGWPEAGVLDPQTLWTLADSLWFGDLFELGRLLRAGQWPGAQEWTIGLAGALFNWTIIRSLWNFRRFARHDSDYVALARLKAHQGDVAAAMDLLKQVKSFVPDFHALRAALNVQLASLADAWEDTVRALDPGMRDNADNRFLVLHREAAGFDLPRPLLADLVRFGMARGAGDFAVYPALNGLMSDAEGMQLAAGIFQDETAQQEYRICFALFLMRGGRRDEAEALLGDVDVAGDREFLRAAMVLLFIQLGRLEKGVADMAERRRVLDAWTAGHIDPMTRALGALAATTDLRFLAGDLHLLRDWAEEYGSAYQQAWRHREQEVRRALAGVPGASFNFAVHDAMKRQQNAEARG